VSRNFFEFDRRDSHVIKLLDQGPGSPRASNDADEIGRSLTKMIGEFLLGEIPLWVTALTSAFDNSKVHHAFTLAATPSGYVDCQRSEPLQPSASSDQYQYRYFGYSERAALRTIRESGMIEP
jgi:hypothetical protein